MNYILKFDTITYLTANPNATFGDVFQNVLLPKVQEVFPTARYEEMPTGSKVVPCILLPWADGTIDGNLFIWASWTTSASSVIGTSNLNVELGVINSVESTGFTDMRCFVAMVGETSRQATYPSGLKPTDYNTYMRVLKHDDGYNIGIAQWKNSDNFVTCSMPYFITRFKKGDDLVNGVISYPFNNGNSTVPSIIDVGIAENGAMNSQRIYLQSPYAVSNNNYWKAGEGLVNKLSTGAYTHPTFYMFSGAYTSLSANTISNSNTNIDRLRNSEFEDNMWIDNAFTIDGESFDAWLLSDVHTNAIAGVGFCRKHIPDNPNA